MNNYDYPPGSDTSDAPWNQVEYPEREIEVEISVTLSKKVRILVDDYTIEEDEYGYRDYDFSECDLRKAVEDQVTLPHNLATFTERIFEHDLSLKAAGMPFYLKDAISECKGWSVDDVNVELV